MRYLLSVLLFLTTTSVAMALEGQRVLSVCGDSECAGTSNRRYFYYLPPNFNASRKTPVLMILHGSGVNGAATLRLYGLIAKANKEGFILVAPDATPCPEGPAEGAAFWNSGAEKTCPLSQADDVGFLRAVVADLSKGLKLTPDPRRLFIAGHSGGANMAYRMACEASDLFAAAGTVAGVYGPRACPMSQPVSIIAFNTTSDLAVAYSKGPSLTNCLMDQKAAPEVCFRSNSVPQTIDVFMQANQCARVAQRQTVVELATPGNLAPPTRTVLTYTQCRSNVEVQLNRLEMGAESSNAMAHLYWPTTLTDLIWQFFQNHSR